MSQSGSQLRANDGFDNPNVKGTRIGLAANTRSDGVGTIGVDLFLAFVAAAAGSFLEAIRLMPHGAVAGSATTATVHRIYLSTKQAGVTTADDTFLIAEISAPSVSADDAANGVPTALEVALMRSIPSGMFVLISSHHVNAANTGWHATAFGGDN